MKRELSATAVCSVLVATFFVSLGSEASGAASATGASAIRGPQPTPTPSYKLKCLGIGLPQGNGQVQITNEGLGSVPAGTSVHWYVSSTTVTVQGKQGTLPPVDGPYTFGQALTAGGKVAVAMPSPTPAPGPQATGAVPWEASLALGLVMPVLLAQRACSVGSGIVAPFPIRVPAH